MHFPVVHISQRFDMGLVRKDLEVLKRCNYITACIIILLVQVILNNGAKIVEGCFELG